MMLSSYKWYRQALYKAGVILFEKTALLSHKLICSLLSGLSIFPLKGRLIVFSSGPWKGRQFSLLI